MREEFSSPLNDLTEEKAEFRQLNFKCYPVGSASGNRREVNRYYPIWRDKSPLEPILPGNELLPLHDSGRSVSRPDRRFFKALLLWSRSVICYRAKFRSDDKRMDSIAGEAAKEIFLSAQKGSFQGHSKFTSWGYVLIQRALCDYWQREAPIVPNATTYSLEAELETLGDYLGGQEDGTLGGGEHRYAYEGDECREMEWSIALDSYLATLAPLTYLIVHGKLSGLTDKEIAKKLKMKTDGVKYRYGLIRASLRKITLLPKKLGPIYEGEQLVTVSPAYRGGLSREAPFNSLRERLRLDQAFLDALKASPERHAWVQKHNDKRWHQGTIDGASLKEAEPVHKRDPFPDFETINADLAPPERAAEIEERRHQGTGLANWEYARHVAQFLLVPWQSDWHANGARFQIPDAPKRATWEPTKIFVRSSPLPELLGTKTVVIEGLEQTVRIFAYEGSTGPIPHRPYAKKTLRVLFRTLPMHDTPRYGFSAPGITQRALLETVSSAEQKFWREHSRNIEKSLMAA